MSMGPTGKAFSRLYVVIAQYFFRRAREDVGIRRMRDAGAREEFETPRNEGTDAHR